MASTVEVKITVDGKKLEGFMNLSVRQDIMSHHSFDLICRMDAFDRFSSSSEAFILDKAQDLIGKKIKIDVSSIGKNDKNGSDITIFKGVILEIQGNKYQDAFSGSIQLKGSSMDMIMDGDHQCRSFEDSSLNDIVEEVTRDYSSNLFDKTHVAPRYKTNIPYAVQYNETNFEFLLRLAKTYGEWMLVTGDNQFYFGEPPGKKDKLLHGMDLFDFSFSMKLDTFKFKYRSYDYFKQTPAVTDSSVLNPKTDGFLSTSLHSSDDLYSKSENFYFNRPLAKDNSAKEMEEAVKTDKRSRVAGLNFTRGSSDNCELKIGNKIEIEGYVDNGQSVKNISFGEYRITSLTHSCDEGGNYVNYFEGVPADAEAPPYCDPFLFPKCETQSAEVTDTNDPDGLGRVRVKFFWSDNKESPWLRVVTPYAGNNKGIYFIPEIGEEVLIGFESQNAEKPYVKGSLYNGKNKPDDWKDAKNIKKGIRTKSGHTIEFNDNAGKEEIIIYDKDHVNTITLSSHSKELKVVSTGDIKIQADKNIEIKAKSNITIKADKDISIEGVNIDIKAQGNMTADVTGKASVSAKQDLSLKGMNIKAKANAQLGLEGTAMAELKASIIKIG